MKTTAKIVYLPDAETAFAVARRRFRAARKEWLREILWHGTEQDASTYAQSRYWSFQTARRNTEGYVEVDADHWQRITGNWTLRLVRLQAWCQLKPVGGKQ